MKKASRLPATVGAVRDLVEAAFDLRFDERNSSLELATKAVLLAESCAGIPPDLAAAAWALYGNALRATGKLDRAEGALARAERELPEMPDPRIKGFLLEVTASLRRKRGRHLESVECAENAAQFYRELGDCQGELRCFVYAGNAFHAAGRHSEALERYASAMSLLTTESDFDAFFASAHGAITSLVAVGQIPLAQEMWERLRSILEAATAPYLVGRAHWIRARLLAAQGQRDAALAAYQQTLDAFAQLGIAPEVDDVQQEMARLEPAATSLL